MIKRNIIKVYYIILPLLILGITFRFTTFSVALASLVPLLLLANRHSLGIFFLMYGGPLSGVTRAMYPFLPFYGLAINFLGILLVFDLVLDLVRHNLRIYGGMVATLFMFGLFYWMGPQTDFAKTKFMAMTIHGLMMVIGYYVFDRSRKVDAECLSRLLIVASICMSCYVIQTVSMSPGGLFDYNWFRDQLSWYDQMNEYEGGTLVGYQHIGMLLLLSIAVFLSQTKLQRGKAWFYVLCVAQLVLMSGCRQAVLGLILVVSMRFVVFTLKNVQRRNIMTKLIRIFVGSIISFVLIVFILDFVDSDVINLTLTEGDQGRMIHYLESLSIFKDFPLLGSGIGGYQAITGHIWSHNLFLELLCETGIVGTTLSIILLLSPFVRSKLGLLYITSSNMFYFLILMAIFVRVMFSSDLRESIELFSAVFVILASRRLPNTL